MEELKLTDSSGVFYEECKNIRKYLMENIEPAWKDWSIFNKAIEGFLVHHIVFGLKKNYLLFELISNATIKIFFFTSEESTVKGFYKVFLDHFPEKTIKKVSIKSLPEHIEECKEFLKPKSIVQ